MFTLNVPSAATRLPFSGRVRSRNFLSVRASDGNSTSSFAEGSRVKVVKPIKVYHVPKHADGLVLEGMEGTLAKDVSQYNGKVLSANLRYKVQFETEKDGAPLKFIAHLEEDEIQSV